MTMTQLSPWLSAARPEEASTDAPAHRGKHAAGGSLLEAVAPVPAIAVEADVQPAPRRARVVTLELGRLADAAVAPTAPVAAEPVRTVRHAKPVEAMEAMEAMEAIEPEAVRGKRMAAVPCEESTQDALGPLGLAFVAPAPVLTVARHAAAPDTTPAVVPAPEPELVLPVGPEPEPIAPVDLEPVFLAPEPEPVEPELLAPERTPGHRAAEPMMFAPEPEPAELPETGPIEPSDPVIRRGGSHAAWTDTPVAEPTGEQRASDVAADGMWPEIKPGRRTPAWTDVVDHEADLAFEISRAVDLAKEPPAGRPTGMQDPESWQGPGERSRRSAVGAAEAGRTRPVLFGVLGLVLGLVVSGVGLVAAWAVLFGLG